MLENRQIRRLNSRHTGRTPAVCARRASPLLIFVAFLSLAIQLFVVQVHIHGTPFTGARDNVAAAGAAPSGIATHPDRFPIKDDPANCPLCQEFAHSGGYLHSAQTIDFLIQSMIAAAWVVFATQPPSLQVPHFWFGRAPPAKL
jgi:hypothetical protein